MIAAYTWAGTSEGQTPIERAAPAAVEFRGRPIQEQRFGRAIVVIGKAETFANTRSLPNGQPGGVIGGRFVAVELGHIKCGDASDLGHARWRFVDEDTHAPNTRS